MCVDEIRLKNAHPHLAILDDDPNTLTALCKQLDSVFDVSPFSEGKALLRSPLVSRFDGYLLDWRLEDISGEELVTSIRRLSDAPIFIVTGQKSSNEIARIIASANIRYVVKPIDEVILAAELMNAIKLHGISRRLIS
jgi:DNA-binding response OmpR family regulator